MRGVGGMYAFDAFCIWMRAWCSLDYCERSDILLYALLSVESGRARRQCVGIGVISTQLDTLDLAFSGKAVVGGGGGVAWRRRRVPARAASTPGRAIHTLAPAR